MITALPIPSTMTFVWRADIKHNVHTEAKNTYSFEFMMNHIPSVEESEPACNLKHLVLRGERMINTTK